MAGTVFPALIKLEHQPGSAAQSFLREVEGALRPAEDRFKEFSGEARRALEQALSTPRNAGGSLDLGVAQMKQAAQASQARAIAAREMANATAAAAREEGDYSQKARLAIAATEAVAREEEQAARAAMSHAAALEQVQAQLDRTRSGTDAVILATGRGTEANRMMVNSSRSVRLAMVQSGQQLQDIAISLYSGQRASVVFAQQLPQLAFALTSLEGSANKTHARIGKFATFLSGPWGLAVGLAAGVVVSLIADLLDFGEAADTGKAKAFDFAEALDVTRLSAADAATAMEQLEQATRGAISAQGDYLDTQAATARKAVTDLEERLASQQRLLQSQKELAGLNVITRASDAALGTTKKIEDAIAATQAALASARAASVNADIAESQRRVTESLDEGAAAAGEYARAIADLNRQFRRSQDDPIGASSDGVFITQDGYEREFRRLTQLKKAAEEATKSVRGGASAAAQASLGDMTALVKQLFPGATITSTTGGRHTKGSDHYAGRAIDFVPAGGMGQFTTAEVEQILRDAGVDIRRNVKGVEQMFGPGRSASKPGDHDDHFHFAWQGAAPDPEKVRAALAKAQQAMEEYAQRSGESIARINERFDEQPRLIDQAAQATRQLDAIIADLAEKKPPNFEALIADAEAAKLVVQDALVRPFEDLARESERRLQIEGLLTSGREREAAVLQEIWRMESQIGDLTESQRADVRDIVEHEYDRIEALRRVQEMQSAYLDATRQIRGELESFFAGDGANFGRIAKQLTARITVENLFGDALREIEQSVKSGFDRSVDFYKDETERAGKAALTFADTVNEAARRISDPAYAEFTRSFDATFGTAPITAAQAAANDNGGGEIIVTADRNSVNGLTPGAYFEMIGRKLVDPLLSGLDEIVGVKLSGQIKGVLGSAVGGYMAAGPVGGALGALKGLGLGGKAGAAIDGAFGGAMQGAQTDAIFKSLGIKSSQTGAAIGGAVGSLLPIPGGQIIGSIAGGLLGGLFKSNRSASAVLTGGGGYTLTGKDKGNYGAANDLGGAVMTALNRLAEELDAELGSFFVNIGTRGNSFRVNANSQSLKLKNGAKDFGDDQAAAIAYAVANAVADGAIKGLSAAEQRLLQANDDIEAALKDVLDFRSVARRLKEYKDPVGAALDELDAEFEHLKDLFDRAGASAAEYAQLEELYGIERAKAIKEATETVSGALQDLMDFLTTGDSGLSLRDREGAARTQYDTLATRVRAGDTSAWDDFAQTARELLDIERQIHGSQSGYFNLFDEVKALTQTALDASSTTSGVDPAILARETPFSANDNQQPVVDQLEQVNSQLGAVNQNLGALIGAQSGSDAFLGMNGGYGQWW